MFTAHTTMSQLRYELYFIIPKRQGLFSTTEAVVGYRLQGIKCQVWNQGWKETEYMHLLLLLQVSSFFI